MEELRARIQNERRRLKQVREALSAAIEKKANGDASFVPFYIAIGDYFEAAMHRLHTQDVRMGDMLKEKLPDSEEVREALKELDFRLSTNQKHLDTFMAARDALKEKGAEALETFEQAAKAYTDFILASMGHHGPSTGLAQENFTQKDWEVMAYIEPGDMEREKELHDRVFATQPECLRDKEAS